MPSRIVAIVGSLILTLPGFGSSATSLSVASARHAAKQSSSQTYRNPVLAADFPDPFVLAAPPGGYWRYYAYATGSAGTNLQVAVSRDLFRWVLLGDPMPDRPKWVDGARPDVWAPEVILIGGKYVLYYSARHRDHWNKPGEHTPCISVAISDSPTGPFEPPPARDLEPLFCQESDRGVIDPSPFLDSDGSLYLYYKNDGNCCGGHTYIFGRRLSRDGLNLGEGEPVKLVGNDALWEGPLVEAPTMTGRNGRYYLFFSANSFSGSSDRSPYAVGYARCDSALPGRLCEQAEENPILSSRMDGKMIVRGPGHQSIFQLGKETWIFYHAAELLPNGQRGNGRFMYMDRMLWDVQGPSVVGPTQDAQPIP